MSNTMIPPLLSNSPPPISGLPDDEFDDEFGDFTGAVDFSYDGDSFSIPPTPDKKVQGAKSTDINSNKKDEINMCEVIGQTVLHKDFHDRRKGAHNGKIDCTECPNIIFLNKIVNGADDDSISISTYRENELSEPGTIFSAENANSTLYSSETLEKHIEKNGIQDFIEPNLDIEDMIPIGDYLMTIENDYQEIDFDDNIIYNCDNPSKDDLNDTDNEQTAASSKDESMNVFDECIKAINVEKDFIQVSQSLSEHSVGEPFKESWTREWPLDEEFQKDVSINMNIEENVSFDKFACFQDSLFKSDLKFGVFKTFSNELETTGSITDDSNDIKNREQSNLSKYDFEQADFAVGVTSNLESSHVSDDDFGDFGCYATPQTWPEKDLTQMISIDPESVYERSKQIFEIMFPVLESDQLDYFSIDHTVGNIVFDGLKEITETNALSYQWPKSNSQKNMLKALNIDIRNILYGSPWNPSVPKFAANLGPAPLEPVRSEVLSTVSLLQTPFQSTGQTQMSSTIDVPVAQFDWGGSGLLNPLDSTSSEEQEQHFKNFGKKNLVGSAETISKTTVEVLPDFSYKHIDTKSMKTLQLNDFPIEEMTQNSNKDDDFDKFTSYQNPPKNEPLTTAWNTMLPLRETYISNQPVNFQGMSCKQSNNLHNSFETSSNVNVDQLGSVEKDFEPTTEVMATIATKSATLSALNRPAEDTFSNVKSSSNQNKVQDTQEDEFTEFYSSVPDEPKEENTQLVQSVCLEPLRASPVVKPVTDSAGSVSGQINWPDPGISDVDINNLVVAYVRTAEPSANEDKKINNVEKIDSNRIDGIVKENSLDDEEWSDFVSVKEPIKSRTSTPDLPLSVFNLGSVQPFKQPTPVLTYNGLIQTKIPSSPYKTTKIINSPLVVQATVQQPAAQQPFTTSQFYMGQFYENNLATQAYRTLGINSTKNDHRGGAASQAFQNEVNSKVGQMYQNFRNDVGQINYNSRTEQNMRRVKIEPNSSHQPSPSFQNMKIPASSPQSNALDDDDWSDFVSSAPPTAANHRSGSTCAPPNIITNPGHGNSFSLDGRHSPKQHATTFSKNVVNVQTKLKIIPSISAMPDLDFVAPNNARTFKK